MSSSSESDELRLIEQALPYCLGRPLDPEAVDVVLRDASHRAPRTPGPTGAVLAAVRDCLVDLSARRVRESRFDAEIDPTTRAIAAIAVEDRRSALFREVLAWQQRRAEMTLPAGAPALDILIHGWCRAASAASPGLPDGTVLAQLLSSPSQGSRDGRPPMHASPDLSVVRFPHPALRRAASGRITDRAMRRNPALAIASASASAGKVQK